MNQYYIRKVKDGKYLCSSNLESAVKWGNKNEASKFNETVVPIYLKELRERKLSVTFEEVNEST